MNTCDLRETSLVSDAVRAALTGKAAMLGAPFAVACNAFIPPAAAQDQEPSDQVSGRAEQASDEAIDEIVVRGRVTLRHNEAFSATKMNQELKDIAQSVSVITEDLIEMADVQKFQDIYRVDASVGTSHRLDDFPTNFFRGFTIQGNNAIRVDGFRFPGNVELDLATFERFELVKGPTSALFGQNSLGGTINAVTKQPTPDRVGEIGLEVGSFDSYRADIDLGGPLSADERWQYRVIGVYRTSDTYIDFSSDAAFTIAPSIAYDLSDQTRIVASLN
jgi:iron complex outermembrane receptor protein